MYGEERTHLESYQAYRELWPTIRCHRASNVLVASSTSVDLLLRGGMDAGSVA
jgi:hypothetical protein